MRVASTPPPKSRSSYKYTEGREVEEDMIQKIEIHSNEEDSSVSSSSSFESSSNDRLNKNNTRSGNTALVRDWNPNEVRYELRKSTMILSHYSLKLSSKWTAELAMSLPETMEEMEQLEMNNEESRVRNVNKNLKEVLDSLKITEENCTEAELYAKSLLDLGEYERAAHVLSSKTSKKKSSSSLFLSSFSSFPAPLSKLSSYGIFLRCYALYLAGERRKEEEMIELKQADLSSSNSNSNSANNNQQQQQANQQHLSHSKSQNPFARQLLNELKVYLHEEKLNAFGLYLYAILLPNSSGEEKLSTLLNSIRAFPWNWSAWLDVASYCLVNEDKLETVEQFFLTNNNLSNHYMYHFFLLHVFLEKQQNDEAFLIIDRLSSCFVNSRYLLSQTAVTNYNLRLFDEAQAQFETLLSNDPYRLENIDTYSNILFVHEHTTKLSQLAHHCVKVDKYRPETCLIIGNYYSLKQQHSKAILYFTRALKLNRHFLSAYTLIGHEFVEMKNIPAAIEAYRRAVDCNPRDYRAWYGLGQTYEILNMMLYALYYFKKACLLRSYDARMWCALGSCYENLQEFDLAIKSYERAVICGDREGVATRKLACLYRDHVTSNKVHHQEKASKCFLQYLIIRFGSSSSFEKRENLDHHPQLILLDESIWSNVTIEANDAEAFLYLAFYFKKFGNFDFATKCCERLLEYPGTEKEEAKALLREIRSRLDQRHTTSTNTSSRLDDSSNCDVHQTFDQSLCHDTSRMLDVSSSSFDFSP